MTDLGNRRVVTGLDAEGKSAVVIDGPIPRFNATCPTARSSPALRRFCPFRCPLPMVTCSPATVTCSCITIVSAP